MTDARHALNLVAELDIDTPAVRTAAALLAREPLPASFAATTAALEADLVSAMVDEASDKVIENSIVRLLARQSPVLAQLAIRAQAVLEAAALAELQRAAPTVRKRIDTQLADAEADYNLAITQLHSVGATNTNEALQNHRGQSALGARGAAVEQIQRLYEIRHGLQDAGVLDRPKPAPVTSDVDSFTLPPIS